MNYSLVPPKDAVPQKKLLQMTIKPQNVCVCVVMVFQMRKETETASQQESGLPSAFLVSYQGR